MAPEFESGWTLKESQKKYFGASSDPFKPLHVEYIGPQKMAPSFIPHDFQYVIIGVTILITAVFLAIQVGN